MPNPRRRHSRTRRDKRRTHDKLPVPQMIECSNCGTTVQFHRVCPECGFYKGKHYIEKQIAV